MFIAHGQDVYGSFGADALVGRGRRLSLPVTLISLGAVLLAMGLLGTYATALEAFDDKGVVRSPWGEGLPWFAVGGVIEGAGIVVLVHRLARSLLVTALALVLMGTTYLIGVGTVMALRDQDLARYAAGDCSRGCSGPAPVVTRRSG